MLDKYDYSYNYEKSVMHLVSPVIKFISLFVYIIICFLPYNNFLFIFLLSYVFILLLLSNINLKRYFKVLWRYRIIYLILFFYMYSIDVTIYNGLVIYFKLIFFLLHFFFNIFTSTRSDYVRGITWVIDRFNVLIKKKKIYNFIDNIYTFCIYFIDNFNSVIKYKELSGKSYIYSDLFVKFIFIVNNFKLIFNLTKESVKVRNIDKRYRLFDVNVIKKYIYVSKLCFIDYFILIINMGMIIFYIMKVR